MTREELIKALDMDENLCVRGSSEKGILFIFVKYWKILLVIGILTAFAKYQEINKAYTQLQNSKDWPGKKPLRLAIIELCMSKSQFYDDFQPLFSEALKYPELMEWLKQEEDCMTGYDLFGIDKAVYSKPDLVRWMEKKREKVKVKGKGKEKDKSSGSGKRSHKKE